MPKTTNVRLKAPDAELEFAIQRSTTGKQLFEQVAKTVGIREIWYFGINFIDSKGQKDWIKLSKKVIDGHDIRKQDPLELVLKIKFYPEDVEEELIQEVTKKYFFIELKEAVLHDEIYCPPETCVLLASYACQVKFGDYDDANQLPNTDRLLPARVLEQHSLTQDEWKARIVNWWKEHRDMLKDDAMLEYIKIGQDLEMYGVNYFDIKNRRGTDLLLGVDALGLNIYEKENRLTPRIGFPWSEIRNISFDDKKFIIKSIDKKAPNFVFVTTRLRINKRILALCMGNHELYMRRRKPDTIEIQQMKTNEREGKEAKLTEKRQIRRFRDEKEASIRRKMEVEDELRDAKEQVEAANRQKREAEENLCKIQDEKDSSDKRAEELLSEKYKLEEEMGTLEQSRVQVENDLEMQSMQHQAQNAEQRSTNNEITRQLEVEKEALEEKIHQTNMEQKRQREEFQLREREYELSYFRQKEVRRKVSEENVKIESADMAHSAYIEHDRSEEDRQVHVTKGKTYQLSALSKELEQYKTEGGLTEMDRIHQDNVSQGRDKYKTLKQIRQGNTKQRVEQFENCTS